VQRGVEGPSCCCCSLNGDILLVAMHAKAQGQHTATPPLLLLLPPLLPPFPTHTEPLELTRRYVAFGSIGAGMAALVAAAEDAAVELAADAPRKQQSAKSVLAAAEDGVRRVSVTPRVTGCSMLLLRVTRVVYGVGQGGRGGFPVIARSSFLR